MEKWTIKQMQIIIDLSVELDDFMMDYNIDYSLEYEYDTRYRINVLAIKTALGETESYIDYLNSLMSDKKYIESEKIESRVKNLLDRLNSLK